MLGDGALAVHAAWVLFNVLAPVWALRRPRLRIAHMCTMALTLVFALTMGSCPLTHVENWSWARALPGAAYGGGFISHYLWELVYWNVDQRVLNLLSGAWFLGWVAVYAWLWKRRGRTA